MTNLEMWLYEMFSKQDAPNYDVEGNTRPADSGYDIGAYEYGSETPVK